MKIISTLLVVLLFVTQIVSIPYLSDIGAYAKTGVLSGKALSDTTTIVSDSQTSGSSITSNSSITTGSTNTTEGAVTSPITQSTTGEAVSISESAIGISGTDVTQASIQIKVIPTSSEMIQLSSGQTSIGTVSAINTTSTCISITVSWSAVTGATGYDLEADGTVVSSGSGISYTHSALQPNTRHNYRVRAKNTDVVGDWSSTCSALTLSDTIAPSMPANLRSTTVTNTSISLAWDASTDNVGVTGYDIYGFQEQGENLISNGGFESDLSAWGGLGQSGDNLGTISMDTTDKCSGAKSAKIQVTQLGYNSENWRINLNQAGMTITPGKQYLVRFKAKSNINGPIGMTIGRNVDPYDEFGTWEGDNNSFDLGTQWQSYERGFWATKTTIPGQTRVMIMLGGALRTVWLDDIELYEITPIDSNSEAYMVTDTSTTISGLTVGATYDFCVMARDAANNMSVRSNVAKVVAGSFVNTGNDTEDPTAPANLVATNITSTSVKLSWDASTDNVGVTGYDIYRNNTKISSSSSTTFIDTGLTQNTSYTYFVKAFDLAGNTSTSSSSITVSTPASSQILFSSTMMQDSNNDGLTNNLNGSFASGMTGTLSIDGGQKINVTGGSGKVSSNFAYYIYSVTPGTKISVSTDIKVSGDVGVRMLYNFRKSDWSYLSGGTGSGTITEGGDFQHIVLQEQTAPAETVIVVLYFYIDHINTGSTGTVWLKNALIKTSTLEDTIAPTTPSGITVPFRTTTAVELAWIASSDNTEVIRYDIYRNNTRVGSSAGTSYIDKGLSPGAVYYYTIKALDAKGNTSQASNSKGVFTIGTDGERLYNNSFDVNLNGWYAGGPTNVDYVRDATTFFSTPACLKISCKNTGTDIYSIQMSNYFSINIQQGKCYSLVFRAKASTNINIPRISLMKGADPWSNYAEHKAGTRITTEWDTYILNFTANTTADDAIINFYLGTAMPVGAVLYLDSFSLKESADSERPTAPRDLLISSKSASTVSFGWTAATDNVGVVGYDIYRDGTKIGSSSTTSYADIGLFQNTKYVYSVKARDAFGNESDFSELLNAVTNLGLSAPRNLRCSSISDTAIKLDWDAPAISIGIAGYELYNGSSLMASIPNVLTYTASITPGALYELSIKAKDTGGSLSDKSNTLNISNIIVDNAGSCFSTDSPWTVSQYDSGYYGANYQHDGSATADSTNRWAKWTPSIMRAGNYNVYLRWAQAGNRPDAVPLEISYNGGIDKSKTVNEQINGGKWVLIGTYSFAAGTSGYVKILATDAGYTIADAVKLVLSESTDTVPPTAPTGLISDYVSDNRIDLSWTASSDNVGVTSYEIYNNTQLLGSTTGATTYSAIGLTPNTSYQITVKAKDAQGNCSDPSNVLSVTTKKTVTDLFGLEAVITGTSILVKWKAIDGGAMYDLEVDGNVMDNGTKTTYLHTGLSANTMHSYRVRYRNAAGTGDWSSKVTCSLNKTSYIINCTQGKEFIVMLDCRNISDFSGLTMTFGYNASELEVLDLSSLTKTYETTVGAISGTDVEVLEVASGQAKFKVNRTITSGNTWSGVANTIRVRCKMNGVTRVSYSMS